MAAQADGESAITSINVTPLVDILLVVLIIFMITAPIMHKRTLKVSVPRAAHSDQGTPGAVHIVVSAKGAVSLSGSLMNKADMARILALRVSTDPHLAVALAADKSASYGDVVSVLDAVRGAGVLRIGLEVVPK